MARKVPRNPGMRAKTLEELQVWQRALVLAEALSAVTADQAFNRHARLREQIDDASDSLVSNIAEGFGQGTDRAFARYLYIARGSANEIGSHMAVARARKLTSGAVAGNLIEEARQIGNMISGLIAYLLKSDWKDRY